MLKALSSQRTKIPKGDLPDRLVVVPWGESEINDGEKISVAQKTLSVFAANQEKYNFDRVALDFEHQTVPGSKTHQKDPVVVAAYGVPCVVEGEGIVLENLEWTEEGKTFVGGRHYIDCSPVVKHDEQGEVIFLHSAAACRQGQVRGLSLFSAADPFNNDSMENYKKILTTLLGLAEDATDEQIESGAKGLANKMDDVKSMTADLEKLKGEIKSLSATPPQKEEGDTTTPAELTQLTADVKELQGSVKTLSAHNEQLERDNIAREAMQQGKVIPASAKDFDLKSFKALVADLPADQVPVSRRTPDGLKDFTAKAADDGSADVRKQLGISDSDWEKHNK